MSKGIQNIGWGFLILLILPVCIMAQTGYQKPDPLYGNYILGNSAEIVTFFPGLPGVGFGHLSVSDYNSANGTIVKYPYLAVPAFEDYEDMKILDVVSADFDGDGFDEIAGVFSGNNFNHPVQLLYTSVNKNTMAFENSLLRLGGGDVFDNYLSYKYNNLSLFTGFFNDDDKADLAILHWNSLTKDIWLRIMTLGSNGEFEKIAYAPIQYMARDAGNTFMLDACRFDGASGDFNGDGIDEIIFVYNKFIKNNHIELCSKVYQVDTDQQLIIEKCSVDSIFSFDPQAIFSNGDTHKGQLQFLNRLNVKTGDFDGNLKDEAIINFQMWDGLWKEEDVIFYKRYDYETRHWIYLQPLRVDTYLQEIVCDTNNRTIQKSAWPKHFDDYLIGDTYDPFISGPDVALAVGDLNLDGRDDIVSGALDEIAIYTCDANLGLHKGPTVSRSFKWTNNSIDQIIVADVDLDPDAEKWQPEIIVSDWNGSTLDRRMRILRANYSGAPPHNFTNYTELAALIYNDNDTTNIYGQAAMAVGDFDGDGVRLGQPEYIHIDSFSQPTVILNVPPFHYDILNQAYDINGVFNGTGMPFKTTYTKTTSEYNEFQTEVKTDWGIEASVKYEGNYMGVNIGAHFSAKYGENFSDLLGSSETYKYLEEEGAQYQNRIYYMKSEYDIWEYPVYATESDTGHLVIVRPGIPTGSWESISYFECDKYFPPREPGNLFSYPEYTNLYDNPYIDTIIKICSDESLTRTSSAKTWELVYSNFDQIQSLRSKDIGFELGGSINGYGLAVDVTGHYGREEISTHKSSVLNELGLTVNAGNIINYYADYKIMPYMYWATNGALVVDYNVHFKTKQESPYLTTWWDLNYSSLPDLAFILPRKYDTEKGIGDSDFWTHEISFNADSVSVGDTVLLSTRIHNFSLIGFSGEIAIQFFIEDPELGGQPIYNLDGETQFVLDTVIGPRGVIPFEIFWEIPALIPDSPAIYVTVDYLDQITEIHENNNKGFRILPVDGITTDIDGSIEYDLPVTYNLSQNYPNPFNPTTNIDYQIPRKTHVNITIYNLLGQKVQTLVDEIKSPGLYQTTWNGTNEGGEQVSSGIYLYRLNCDNYQVSKKMLLLK